MSAFDPVEKVLKEHLDELSQDELKTFQWHLTVRYQAIPKSQLENATREQTVDKMVQTYGEEPAVEITVDVFSRINRNDLQVKLTQVAASRGEQQSTERQTQRNEESDFSCAVCFHIYTEPVMLQCGHSFCMGCLQMQREKMRENNCPLCRKQIRELDPPINLVLKNLCENHRNKSQTDPSGGHGLQSHQNIKEKKEAFEKVKQFCDSSIENIKSQSCDTEKKIKEDFNKLHLFLREEEEARIKKLKEEETKKIQMIELMTDLSRDTFLLSDTVKEMEDLGADSSFIQTFKTQMERAQNALPDPKLLPQPLIDVSKHVKNLQFRVWWKMMRIVQPVPFSVAYSTASSWLHLLNNYVQRKRPANPHILESSTASSSLHRPLVTDQDKHPRSRDDDGEAC
ncbi:E3 ubiquitin-protein ligase TRIM35-like isoform X1 [Mugil cephalus]|uniref:E3 ubiquitin-protein ligase TRIM35-like isoform X1 n=1 Tax=Mugil cephalus TaxID=48193 RepID=UPI001FB673C7|nr:E3 ubiquitin-protein ligase TRIM35-like isoform X1 [Mugil cephalus]